MIKMADANESLDELMRRAAVERMVLNYYNNVLLDKGVITKDQHLQMQVSIASRNIPMER
jgi:hypothetical protein